MTNETDRDPHSAGSDLPETEHDGFAAMAALILTVALIVFLASRVIG